MVKRIIFIITFIFSILVFVALIYLIFEMIRQYNYINSLPSASGFDYLGFLFCRMFCCITALPGVITSAICLKISYYKTIKILSCILLNVFIVVFVVFGIAWLFF